MYLTSKRVRIAGDRAIYRYKNLLQKQSIFKENFILGKIK